MSYDPDKHGENSAYANKYRTITDKLHLRDYTARWILNITQKHHIWIANQIKMKSSLVSNAGYYDFKTIMEWKKQDQFHNLKELSFEEALKLARDFFYNKNGFIRTYGSLKNDKIYLDCGEYKWVALKTYQDCEEEGFAMSHCVKNGDFAHYVKRGNIALYSLRDKYNKPHITLEIVLSKGGHIRNLFGKGNSIVKDCYIPYLADFLENNRLWHGFNPNHQSHYVAQTITRVLLYAFDDGRVDLVKKIIKTSSRSFRGELAYCLKDCQAIIYDTDRHDDYDHYMFEIRFLSKLMGLNNESTFFWFLTKSKFRSIKGIIERGRAAREKRREEGDDGYYY